MRALACLCITGFSTQILSTGAFQQSAKSAAPSSSSRHICSRVLPGGGVESHLTPELHSRVHGGCATISMSQPQCRTSRTSPWIWRLLLVSAGRRSQLHASCPRARKASRTVPENSQATSTCACCHLHRYLAFFARL